MLVLYVRGLNWGVRIGADDILNIKNQFVLRVHTVHLDFKEPYEFIQPENELKFIHFIKLLRFKDLHPFLFNLDDHATNNLCNHNEQNLN